MFTPVVYNQNLREKCRTTFKERNQASLPCKISHLGSSELLGCKYTVIYLI